MANKELGSLYVRLVASVDKFQKGLSDAEKSVVRLGKKFKGVGREMSEGLSLPLAGIAAVVMSATNEIDGAMDKIRISSGKTGAELDSLSDSFIKVFKDTPSSANDVATAITQLGIKTGQTGAGLEELAKQTLTLARITGQDLNSVMSAAVRIFTNFKVPVEDQAEALNKLFRASQISGQGVATLSDNLATLEVPLRALGFTFDQSVALLAKWGKEGLNAEIAMAGLRTATMKLAQAGTKDMGASFRGMVQEIKALGPGARSSQMAIELFGKSGVAMATAIHSGKFEISDMLSRLKNSKETIGGAADATDGFAEAMGKFANNLKAAVAPVEGIISRMVKDNSSAINQFTTWIADLAKSFAELSPATQEWVVGLVALGVVMGPILIMISGLVATAGFLITMFGWLVGAIGLILSPAGAVVLAIAAVTVAFQQLYTWGPFVWRAMMEYVDEFVADFSRGVDVILQTWSQFWTDFGTGVEVIKGFILGLGKSFVEMKTAVVQACVDTYEGIKANLVDKLNAITESVRGAVSSVTGFFQGMYDAVIGHSSVPDTVEGIRNEFGKLDTVMVTPVQQATAKSTSYFAQFEAGLKNTLKKASGQAQAEAKKFKEAMVSIAEAIKDLQAEVDPAIDSLRAKLTELVVNQDFDGVRELAASYSKTAEAAKRFKETLADAASDAKQFNDQQKYAAENLRQTQKEIDRMSGALPALTGLSAELRDMLSKGNYQGVKDLAAGFSDTEERTREFADALQDAKEYLGELKSRGLDTAGALTDAFGTLAESLGLSSQSTSTLATLAAAILTGQNTGGAGGELGAKISGMLGGGSSGGGGGGGLMDTISGWFGGGASTTPQPGSADFIGPVQPGTTTTGMSGGDIGGAIQSVIGIYQSIKDAKKIDKANGDNSGTGAAVGGGIGATVGMIFGGPMGAQIGQQVGAAVGELIGSFIPRGPQNAQTQARRAFGSWIEDEFKKLGQVSFFDAQNKLKNYNGENLNFLVGANGRFNPGGDDGEDWGKRFEAMGSEAKQVFEALGESMKSLSGITEDVGGQIGYLLATNLGGNINNARLLVRQLGLSFEDLKKPILDMAVKGEISWARYNQMIAGLTEATGEGLVEIAAYSKALDMLVDSGGDGMDAIVAVTNIATEAIEGKVKDLAELKQKMLAEGADPEVVNALFAALEQRGVKTLEEMKNMSNETAGAVVGDMEALNKGLADKWQAMQSTLKEMQDTIAMIPDKVEKSIDIKVNVSDEDRALLASQRSTSSTDAGTVTKAANGRVVHTPTNVRMAGGGMLRYAELAPEAIMPLARVGGKLGVNVSGVGNGRGNIYIDARGASPGVEYEIQRALKEVEERAVVRAVNAITDNAQRGGTW